MSAVPPNVLPCGCPFPPARDQTPCEHGYSKHGYELVPAEAFNFAADAFSRASGQTSIERLKAAVEAAAPAIRAHEKTRLISEIPDGAIKLTGEITAEQVSDIRAAWTLVPVGAIVEAIRAEREACTRLAEPWVGTGEMLAELIRARTGRHD